MSGVGLDEIDRGLLQALQIDGRVAFSAVAEILGVSDQTVARRYRALRAGGAVHVRGTTWPEAVGQEVWLVRVQCAPEAAGALSRSLARRPDTSWVLEMSGGAEILSMLRIGPASTALAQLPRTPRLTGVSAHCVLYTFCGGAVSPLVKHGPLTTAQCAVLPSPATAPDRDRAVLSDQDQALLDALAEDGRAGYRALAAVTGWSQTSVRRRLAELRRTSVVYFDIDFDAAMLGLRSLASLWLMVEPGALSAAGEALAAHPEVSFAAATTGPANLYASVQCRDTKALYAYLTGPVAQLPGIRSVETAPATRTIKQVGRPQEGGPARRMPRQRP
ncbi:Lrp/AsnC family transcriptional regulator [Streptomyces spectabilis]|uniref:AsnC family transcriptional regulator n=1 Tax=Streptomyces spectabilis TaxID=68270 RepID=A0A5P2X4G6_STRST|nr:AsnC family transcriptional regulator [Streptomyces spectabilis]MBB5108922.1 DNA-binding Lrp family transcriptional regulator [Streptomyces spectabilis]MCI3899786.1 AsnC family transcriptional regulator [Streptomyces spectabilis]QEV57456.1 AsnC family transcriptional regulator [Streptomyces spectabilis]GGV42941.1 AsnC family transcriptional regulator [Streptomyces spectabilis]